jgi:uncharacterized protein (DUF952 family)
MLEEPIYHISKQGELENARQLGEYTPSEFEADGFIHCSTQEQLLAVANYIFHDAEDMVVLEIDSRLVDAEIRWEEVGREKYPHIYGALNLDAVQAVKSLQRDQDGIFIALV